MSHIKDPRTCPNKINHTDSPTSYTQWHVRANEMQKTHVQTLCEQCNTYSIWIEKSTKGYKKNNGIPEINRICQVCGFHFIREKGMHTNHCSEKCFKIHKKKQRNKSYGKGTGYRGRTKKK